MSETFESEHKAETKYHRARSLSPNHSRETCRQLLDKIIEKLFEKEFLTDTLSHGDVKFMVNLFYNYLH